VLRGAESRWQNKRHARFVAIGAVVCVAFLFIEYVVFPIRAEEEILAGGGADWHELRPFLGVGGALAVVALLELTLGRRRKFPYLDEYEGRPPDAPDR